jgi:hypothetical protein
MDEEQWIGAAAFTEANEEPHIISKVAAVTDRGGPHEGARLQSVRPEVPWRRNRARIRGGVMPRIKDRSTLRLGGLCALALAGTPQHASADAGGLSFWLPGSFGSLAATPTVP